jgi:hypothetical protein
MHYPPPFQRYCFKKLIDEQETFELEIQKNLCIYLCLSIMSQQLSTKVAAVFKKDSWHYIKENLRLKKLWTQLLTH